ncbi:unnamed protein product, partial [Sphenostylis stenocarpa]
DPLAVQSTRHISEGAGRILALGGPSLVGKSAERVFSSAGRILLTSNPLGVGHVR